MLSFPVAKRPVAPMYAPTGMRSLRRSPQGRLFDSVAVRFANHYYTQDDTALFSRS